MFFILTGLIMIASCSTEQTPQERAKEMAVASLKMVRLEQQAVARGTDPQDALGEAESIFLNTVQLEPKCIKEFVETGGGPCREQIEEFLESTRGLPAADSRDDPAAVIMDVLTEYSEAEEQKLGLTEGYAAAFQMSMELERDGTVMQDFIPFLLALGCPMTFGDLGLETSNRAHLEKLAALASGRTGNRTYNTEPFDYFITMVKIDSWAGKFSGRVTADTLASRLLKNPGLKQVLIGLSSLPPTRLGFLGDSYMDPIHWSTQAPFPDIIAAVLRSVNPRVTVVNAGKGGDDSGEALERIDIDLIDKRPVISFVMLGGNDCRHWGRPEPAVSPKQYRKNISEITGRLRQSGSRVVLMASPRSPDLSGADLEAFLGINEELKAAADSLETGFIDILSLLAEREENEVFAIDRIHMSPEGHLLVAWKILAYLANLKIEKTYPKIFEIFY